jgi:hypothetical protein
MVKVNRRYKMKKYYKVVVSTYLGVFSYIIQSIESDIRRDAREVIHCDLNCTYATITIKDISIVQKKATRTATPLKNCEWAWFLCKVK